MSYNDIVLRQNKETNVYPCKPQYFYINIYEVKWGVNNMVMLA